MLVELLVISPLLAAVQSGAARTSIVAAYAFLLSVPLGWVSGAGGSLEHLTGVLAVLIGGLLAVTVASLREAREHDAVRLTMQYDVARVLSEASSLEQAVPRLLEAITSAIGWKQAYFWEVRGASALRCMAGWHEPGTEPGDFERVTRELVLRRGFGLPGRAWDAGKPVWVEDVLADESFTRGQEAAREGLHSAVAFPVATPHGVKAAIEVFADEPHEPDRQLIDLLESLGWQIGEFFETLTAQAALRESEAHKSAVLASALDCVISIDDRGWVTEWNNAAERTFGIPAAEAIGREMAELIVPPHLREGHRSGLRRCVETGEGRLLGRRVELVGQRADGTQFPVELALSRIPGSNPALFTGAVRDITERRRAESEREQLLQAEQRARLDATQTRDQLEAMLRGVPDAVTAEAADGHLLFANDAAVETFGFGSLDELLGASAERVMGRFEVLDESGRPLSADQLPARRAFAAGEPADALLRLRVRETGEERWAVL
ncbi:MAG TPA: PAS domain S-box protein, partial [Thermoleophilaceae bacterium]|nr:PAS domain S-box protein [Thermoleophilaceae bacterium]